MTTHHTPDRDPNEIALESAFERSAETPDQAALDRLLRHTRHVSAKKPARGFSWGWVLGPVALAGAAATAAVMVAGDAGAPTTETPVVAEVEPVPVEPLDEALATAFEAEELEPELETLAALGTVETGADADWLAPGAEGDLDDDEVEAWLDAYEAVLAEG